MVLVSIRLERYSEMYTQFDTIRNMRIAFDSYELAYSINVKRNLTILSSGNISSNIISSLTASVWFEYFYSGCRSRMVQIYKPNLVLFTHIIINILRAAREDIHNS